MQRKYFMFIVMTVLMLFMMVVFVGCSETETNSEPVAYEITNAMFTEQIDIAVNVDEMEDVLEPISVGEYEGDLSAVLAEVQKIDSSFNTEDYLLTINIFQPETQSATLMFSYCIDGKIQTNRNYTVMIQNNRAYQIIVNEAFVSEQPAEIDKILNAQLINLVEDFEKEHKDYLLNENDINGKIKSHKQIYYYDYHADVLWYTETVNFETADGIEDYKQVIEYLRGSEADMIN